MGTRVVFEGRVEEVDSWPRLGSCGAWIVGGGVAGFFLFRAAPFYDSVVPLFTPFGVHADLLWDFRRQASPGERIGLLAAEVWGGSLD